MRGAPAPRAARNARCCAACRLALLASWIAALCISGGSAQQPADAGRAAPPAGANAGVDAGAPAAGAPRAPHTGARCSAKLLKGRWCAVFHSQPLLPFPREPPAFNASCPGAPVCGGVGVCNRITGLCDCPAGWGGPDCTRPQKRPCTNRYGGYGLKVPQPAGHIGADGRDLDWSAPGWTASRCGGVCDDDIGACFCDGEPFGRVPAPRGSPPGAPPVRAGRPLHGCKPKQDASGKENTWGTTPYADIYGPRGWCTADLPIRHCSCSLDGFGGHLCDQPTEAFCPNQCSGHGDCSLGFCKCHRGWFGLDCAGRAAGTPVEAPGDEPPGMVVAASPDNRLLSIHPSGTKGKPWLAMVARRPPASLAQPAGATRRRPFIFVYDTPAPYAARMLQYRIERHTCTWRGFTEANATQLHPGWLYKAEQARLGAPHAPGGPQPFRGPRVRHAAAMTLELLRHVQSAYPYWSRSQGRDHVWLFSHDEGACWAPAEVYRNSIILTHWGRTGADHTSNTAYPFDNYNAEFNDTASPLTKDGWTHLIKGHPCYTPGKARAGGGPAAGCGLGPDTAQRHMSTLCALCASPHAAVLPVGRGFSRGGRGGRGRGASARAEVELRRFATRQQILASPDQQICISRGDVGKQRLPAYSRGIRQRLYQLAREQQWRARYNVSIGDEGDVPGDYSTGLATSKYCLVVPGDGFSARAEDSLLHGCVPVIVMDGVHTLFETLLEWDLFSVRVRVTAIPLLPQILMAIPEDRYERMLRRVLRLMHRFTYLSHPVLRAAARELANANRAAAGGAPGGARRGGAAPWGGAAPARGGAVAWADEESDLLESIAGPPDGEEARGGGLEPSGGAAGAAAEAARERRRRRLRAPGGGQARGRRGRRPREPAGAGGFEVTDAQVEDDAFGTVMAFLYAKIPHTRGPPPGGAGGGAAEAEAGRQVSPAALGLEEEEIMEEQARAPAAKWSLVMATHTMEVATAKVPFSMILLLDHVRTKRAMPDEIRCRMVGARGAAAAAAARAPGITGGRGGGSGRRQRAQPVIPSDGLTSVSLWDTSSPEVLRQWLDENLGGDCISQVLEVQEEFTFGCALELARSRGADRVAGGGKKTYDAVAAGLSTASNRIQEWDRHTGVISTARETTASTVAKISDVVTKATENEKVQTALRDTSVAFTAGWRRMSAAIGKLGAAVKEQGLGVPREDSGEAPTYQMPGGQLPPYNNSGGGGGLGGGGGGGGALNFGESDDLDRQLATSAFDPLDSPPPGYAPTAAAAPPPAAADRQP
ncbi:MAG: hypothetical protein J3K34DRAFT_506016 [Monoraphidium minutum]|nr:MAG: hypothetical protein J3K34DRAFT_506016 [Monoraphidium minutum]